MTLNYILSRLFRIALPLAAVLGFWHLMIWLSCLPEFVIPRPIHVLSALHNNAKLIGWHTTFTVQAAFFGLLFSNILGIFFGVIFATIPIANQTLMPIAIAVRNIPFVALATVLALAFGDTMVSKVTLLTVAGFFPVLINTIKGLQSVDSGLLDRMRVLNASPWNTFWLIKMRYALPLIFAAQEIIVSYIIALAIAVEWLLSAHGLGFVINRAMAQYDGNLVYAVTLCSAVLSYSMYMIAKKISHHFEWNSKSNI